MPLLIPKLLSVWLAVVSMRIDIVLLSTFTCEWWAPCIQ